MSNFLWWSGAALWGCAGVGGLVLGLLWLVDPIINFCCQRIWSANEFMAFVRERIRAGKTRPPA